MLVAAMANLTRALYSCGIAEKLTNPFAYSVPSSLPKPRKAVSTSRKALRALLK